MHCESTFVYAIRLVHYDNTNLMFLDLWSKLFKFNLNVPITTILLVVDNYFTTAFVDNYSHYVSYLCVMVKAVLSRAKVVIFLLKLIRNRCFLTIHIPNIAARNVFAINAE